MALRALYFALGLFLVPFAPSKSYAHPHAWIDVSVKVEFDAAGRVVALHQTWLFDDFYSMFVLEGATALGGGATSQSALEDLMRENMANLAEYDYFTEARSGETALSFDAPYNLGTRMDGMRLEMSFALPVRDPALVSDMPFSYSVYDPSYYIEMLHAKSDTRISLINAPATCHADLKQPDPDPEQVMFAASLGQNEEGPSGLGRIFAETALISCN